MESLSLFGQSQTGEELHVDVNLETCVARTAMLLEWASHVAVNNNDHAAATETARAWVQLAHLIKASPELEIVGMENTEIDSEGSSEAELGFGFHG